MLEQLCSGNGQHQSYTASTNTYRRKKTDVDLTSEVNNKYSVYVKPFVSSSKPFESLLTSKVVKIFAKPNDRTVPIENYFESQYK